MGGKTGFIDRFKGKIWSLTDSNAVQFFGGSPTATPLAPMTTMFGGGVIYRNGSAAATGIGANKADTTDDILWGVQLPANALDILGRMITINLQGMFGATANNKRFKLFFNPTLSGQTLTNGIYSALGTVTAGSAAFDSGVQTNNNTGWALIYDVMKYGASGSNTQVGQGTPIYGTTHGGITLPLAMTTTENAAINIIVTGASPTTGAANDVVLNSVQLQGFN